MTRTSDELRAIETRDAIPFNRPTLTGAERAYMEEVLARGTFAGGGPFLRRCNEWLRNHYGAPAALATTSCTHALEMAAMLCELEPDDEVILPSFAFPSTATAFVRCGAKLVFVDVEPTSMNIDPEAVAAAITPRTRVVVALHYAGIACDMQRLKRLADRHDLIIVEDAAQAIFSEHDGLRAGTAGTFSCLSFHETKNIHCGEGGALIINDPRHVARAEILWEKGTDRCRFLRGEIDKYTWRDVGSSFILGELSAAFLLAQLERGEEITEDRLRSWNSYALLLAPLAETGLIEIPSVPSSRKHNGHMFWVKPADARGQQRLISFLKQRKIQSVFHYVPLHSAPAGERFGRFHGEDRHTTEHSRRLVRLPIYYRFEEAERVAAEVKAFCEDRNRG